MDKIMPSSPPPQNNRTSLSNHSTPLKIPNGAERERCCCSCCRGRWVKTAVMQQGPSEGGRGVGRAEENTALLLCRFFFFFCHTACLSAAFCSRRCFFVCRCLFQQCLPKRAEHSVPLAPTPPPPRQPPTPSLPSVFPNLPRDSLTNLKDFFLNGVKLLENK